MSENDSFKLVDDESPERLRELRSFKSEVEPTPGEAVRENYRYQGVNIALRALEVYCDQNHKDIGIPCECQSQMNHIIRTWYGE